MATIISQDSWRALSLGGQQVNDCHARQMEPIKGIRLNQDYSSGYLHRCANSPILKCESASSQPFVP